MAVGRNQKRRRHSSDSEWSGADEEDFDTKTFRSTPRILTRRTVVAEPVSTGRDQQICEAVVVSDASMGKECTNLRKNKKHKRSRASDVSRYEWSGAENEGLEMETEQRNRGIQRQLTLEIDEEPLPLQIAGEDSRVAKRKKRRQKDGSDSEWSGATQDHSDMDGKQFAERIITRRTVGIDRASSSGRLRVGNPSKGKQHGKDSEGLSRDGQNAEAVVICGVCLSEGVDPLDRGKIDCCDHFFCFACIMEWAKVESRCPLCKQRFVTIVKPAGTGTLRSRQRTIRIPTRNQVYVPPEEDTTVDPYNTTVCMECLESGSEHLLLLCDGCDSAAHTYCVGLGRSIPRGDWYCSSCAPAFLEDSSSDSDDEDEEGQGVSSASEDDFDVKLTDQVVSDVTSLVVAALNGRRPTRVSRRASSTRRSWWRSSGQRARRSARGSSQVAVRRRSVFMERSSRRNARTLTQRRRIQHRIHHMRQTWSNLSSLRLASVESRDTTQIPCNNDQATALEPTLFSMQSGGYAQQGNRLLNARDDCPRNSLKSSELAQDKLKSDIEKAWKKLEQARALRSISGSETKGKLPEANGQQEKPRSAIPSNGSISDQFSSSGILREKLMPPNIFEKDYQEGTSLGFSGVRQLGKATEFVKEEAPVKYSSEGLGVISSNPVSGDSIKQVQTPKIVVSEPSLSTIDIKGKGVMLPSFGESSQGRHHIKYKGQDMECSKEAFEGTSAVQEDTENASVSGIKQEDIISHMQDPGYGGKVLPSRFEMPNGRTSFWKGNATLQDSNSEKDHQHFTSLQSSVEKNLLANVAVCGTGEMLYRDNKTDSPSKNKPLKLEYLNNRNEEGCSMAFVSKNGPPTVSQNPAALRAQTNWPQDSSFMKHQHRNTEGFLGHETCMQALPNCQESLTFHARNSGIQKEQQPRVELVSKCESVMNGKLAGLRQREAIKEQVLKMIGQSLKSLLKSHGIGIEKYKEIARSATHHLLATYGLEHNKKLVRSAEVLTCNHTSRDDGNNVFGRFCADCVKHRVTKVLETLVSEAKLSLETAM